MNERRDLRETLTRTHANDGDLRARHRAFETRLAELQRRPYLAPEEELERTQIKKRKLALKDRMEALARAAPPGA